MVTEAVLKKEPKAVLKQLKYVSAVGGIASRLGWDRLRVIMILDEMTKIGLAKRTDESYELTDRGKKALERIETEEVLAELPRIEPWKKFKWSWETKKWEMK